jgi:hypothetical protein
MYKVTFRAKEQRGILCKANYGSWQDMKRGIARVTRLYRHLGEITANTTEI